MDVILHQLGELLLKALPTFILVVLLHFYLKSVFFKPLEKVLHKRYEATEGARKQAAESLERAAAKTTEYENALRAARTELYRQQEQIHKQMRKSTRRRSPKRGSAPKQWSREPKQQIAA